MDLPFSFGIARIYARRTGPIRSRLTTEERMPNANPSREILARDEEGASRIYHELLRAGQSFEILEATRRYSRTPELERFGQQAAEKQSSTIPNVPPPQRSAEPGFAAASTIERAAERLDWTIAVGIRHNTPRGPEEITKQQPQPDPPRVARAPRPRPRCARPTRLPLISRPCFAAVLVAAAAGTVTFLLTHSAGEKATAESAPPTEAPAKAREAVSLMRGLAMMPPPGAAQHATLAGPAPTAAASQLEAKPALGTPLSVLLPSEPEPKAAMIPAATTLEAPSTIASPAGRKAPAQPAFSVAEIATLLARGDSLFATGDVVSARLLYERAADAGEAGAAVRLGETFDPSFLEHPRLRGVRGDPGTAAFWYRRARDLGATGVASRLNRLEAKEGRN